MKYQLIAAHNADSSDVDVIMTAYNHEPYVRQALDSVLMQVTKYRLHMIIGEDCSTDHTREILLQYQKEHPDCISLVLWEENTGGNLNGKTVMQMANSPYVAYLECDDYWVASDKIEKQVSLLENRPEYIASAHNVCNVDEFGAILHSDYELYPIEEPHVYAVRNALKSQMISQTASILHRNMFRNWSGEDWRIWDAADNNGDMKIQTMLGINGDVYYFSEIMSYHRRVFHGDSYTASTFDKNMLYRNYIMQTSLNRYIERLSGSKVDDSSLKKNITRHAWEKVIMRTSVENVRVLLKLLFA